MRAAWFCSRESWTFMTDRENEREQALFLGEAPREERGMAPLPADIMPADIGGLPHAAADTDNEAGIFLPDYGIDAAVSENNEAAGGRDIGGDDEAPLLFPSKTRRIMPYNAQNLRNMADIKTEGEYYQTVRRNLRAVLRHNRHKHGRLAERQKADSYIEKYKESGAGAYAAAIIPRGDMQIFILSAMIAVMSFLSVWSLIAVHFITLSTQAWQSGIAREAVVQIMPAAGQDMEKALHEAASVAGSFGGIANIHIVGKKETQALLTPWLGAGADIEKLPVPRLLILKLQPEENLDFLGLEEALRQNVKGARLDKQQIWAEQLRRGAHILLGGALFAFALVMAVMIFTIVLATGAALAGNVHIIEVLHFIGADDAFVARQFDRHFFRISLQGACFGGAAACSLFALLFIWLGNHRATAEGGLLSALFGYFSPDMRIFAESAVLILCIAALAMFVSHCAIMRRLRKIDNKSGGFFYDEN